MQESFNHKPYMRQSSRILPVNYTVQLPQPMEIEYQSQIVVKPQRCNSKRSFGTNITNCISRNSLPKNVMKERSPDCHQNRKGSKQPQSRPKTTSINQSPISLNQILPYQNQIFAYLQHMENTTEGLRDYMLYQEQIDEHMRAILINWIVDVHEKFRLRTETLFLTIHLIDKFLNQETVVRTQLQLLGIASLFIASKYEEVHVPELKRFVNVCDNAYRTSELLEMQSRILLTIQFSLAYISSMQQVEQKIQLLDLSPDVITYSSFILQLCLPEYRMCKYKSGLMALSAIYLSNKILNTGKINSARLMHQFQLDEHRFKSCLRQMFEIYKRKTQSDRQAVRRKFAKYGVQ